MRITSRNGFWLLTAMLVVLAGCAKAPRWESRDLPKVVDPDGDCRYEAQNGEVRISVPGSAHDLSAELNRMNAPRALCRVEGDFSIRVKIDCEQSPITPAFEARRPYHGAALVIMQDEKNYIRLDRAAVFLEEEANTVKYAGFEERKNGVNNNDVGPTDPAMSDCFPAGDAQMRYLRLDRQGSKVSAYISDDGVRWSYLNAKTVTLRDPVDAGVAVISSAKEPFSVRFSEFGVARLR